MKGLPRWHRPLVCAGCGCKRRVLGPEVPRGVLAKPGTTVEGRPVREGAFLCFGCRKPSR